MRVRKATLGESFTRSERTSRVAFSRPCSSKASSQGDRSADTFKALHAHWRDGIRRYQQSRMEHQRHYVDTQRIMPTGPPQQSVHDGHYGTENIGQKVGSSRDQEISGREMEKQTMWLQRAQGDSP